MSKVFISYRRDDSADVTGRLYDFLIAHLGRDNVFMDVDAIPFGADFRAFLTEAVSRSDVLLAVIGDRWLGAVDGAGHPRLDDPRDFVRLELEAALNRNMPVVPVLVGRAYMPREDELPASLRELVYRNAAQVRPGPDFHADVERLVRALRQYVPAEAPASEPARTNQRPRVFVSHSSRDRDFVVQEIQGPLEAHGIECYVPPPQLQTAGQWERQVRRSMEACDWFVVVLSRSATASRWVHAELAWAADERPGRIVPVVAEDCDWRDFHLVLNTLRVVDFSGDREVSRRRPLAVWGVEEAVNPYVVGKPVQGELFVGRRDILKMVEDNLGPSAGKNILVLRGQRRSGKTSVLLRLRESLAATTGGAYLPVFVDLQGMMGVKGEGPFLHYLAHHIWRDLDRQGVRVSKPALANFTAAPASAFEFNFGSSE